MKTADPEFMRAINRFHVMDAIRRFGPISRVEIAERTELSPTTVSAITAALIDDQLIMTRAISAVRDAARGRPRVMLELNPDAAFVVGVKLAPDQITVAVTNFRADVLNTLFLPVRVDRQPAAVIADLVEDGVRRCIADAGLAIEKISGVCVGLPGIVEATSGRCRQSPVFRERDVAFGSEMATRLGVDTTTDSDANLVTLAEHWFGHGRGLDDFLVVSIEDSLGLGIMHNGELFRGAGGLSPDLGDFLVRPPNGHNTPTRLKDIIGEAIAAEGRWNRSAALTLNDDALRTIGDAIGFAIADLITLFAPPKVVLAGSLVSAGERLLGPLMDAVHRFTPPGLADVSEIIVRDWGDEIWARGAAAMALRDLYRAPWSATGPARPQPQPQST